MSILLLTSFIPNEAIFATTLSNVKVNTKDIPVDFGGPAPLWLEGRGVSGERFCSVGLDDFIIPIFEVFVVNLKSSETNGEIFYEPRDLYRENDLNGESHIIVADFINAFSETPIGFVGKFADPVTKAVSGNILASPKGQIEGYDIILDNCFDKRYDHREDFTIPNALFVFDTQDLPPYDTTEIKKFAKNQSFKLRPYINDKFYDVIVKLTAAAVDPIPFGSTVFGALDVFTTTFLSKSAAIASVQKANWEKIFIDPADSQYRKFVELNFNSNDPIELTTDDTLNNITGLNNIRKKEISLTDTLLELLEKYKGAEIDGSGSWTVIHATHIRNILSLLSNVYLEYQNQLSQYLKTIQNNPKFSNTNLDSLKIYQDRIISSGFNATEIQELKNIGLNDSQISELRLNISSTDLSPDSITNHIQSQENLRIFYGNEILQIQKLIFELNNLVHEIKTGSNIVNFDLLPIANSGGPYFGKENTPITLSGILSQSNNSTIIKYQWDLDSDGFFDDYEGPSPSITYRNSFSGFVGLNVTNIDGFSNIDYSSIQIDKNNNLPEIKSFFPIQKNIKIQYHSNQLFNISAIDVENDELNIEWFLDDMENPVVNGPEFLFSPTINDIGPHSVIVKLSDNNESKEKILYNWNVFVLSDDEDIDGWRANVDCNDNDLNINPGAKEIYHNGINDDCNKFTPDFNVQPIANNISIFTDQNIPINLSLSGTDVNNDQLSFNILENPIHGNLSEITLINLTSTKILYIPDIGFIGNDSFTFTVNDGILNSSIVGFVNITVGSINSPPISYAQNIETEIELPVHVSLNSTDPENDPITFEITDYPLHGNLSGKLPEIFYTPDTNFTGVDEFRFKTSDNKSESNEARILISIKPQPIHSPHPISLIPLITTIGQFGLPLDSPVGISHHVPSNKILISVNYDTGGIPHNFELVNPDGTHPRFTMISGYTDEIKIASVYDKIGGFKVGEFFVGNGNPGEIVRVSPDGRSIQNPWVVLPGEPGLLRGGLYVDRTGVFDGDLVVVTTAGNVWRINSLGEPTFIASLGTKLEGLLTVPNSTLKYGPWAGKILIGAELLNPPGIYSLDSTGTVSFFELGIAPEDFDIIPSNENFYAIDRSSWNILGAQPSEFTGMDGDILITQEVRFPESLLYDVHWDSKNKKFIKTELSNVGAWEHVTFSTASIKDIPFPFNPLNPISDAGPDKIVHENQTNIMLNGIASNDPDGNITSYLWQQIEGPQVHLQNNNGIATLFHAPLVTEDTMLTFNLTVTDNESRSSSDLIAVLVKNVKPIIADAGVDKTVNERTLVTLNGSAINPEGGNTISYKWSQIGGNNTITLNNSDTANTTFIAPNVDINGDIITFVLETINDQRFSDTDDITIVVNDVNVPPTANNQTTDTLENTEKTIQLVATDTDPGDRLFYQILGGPSNGFVSNFNSTAGVVEYHPLGTFHGEDSFTFKVHDGKDKSQPAFVNITVIDDNINDPPRVESERVSANVGQQISVNVLQNDVDPNGDFLTLTNFTGPFNGTAILNQDQNITYQSDPDFNGSDVLYYRVADQFGKFGVGALIIDVKGNVIQQIINVPEDRLVTTMAGQPVQIHLVATAAIERPLTFFLVDPSDNGNLDDVTVLSNLSTSVRYTPNTNFVGEDSFTYLAQDEKTGVISNIGTIRILVEDIVGNPPVATDVQSTVDEDSSVQIQLTASDPDTTDTITYSIESQPFSGQITSFDPSTGILVYKPDSNFNGNDSFLFKALDQDQLESNIATVSITINPVNDPPVANNQQVETDQNVPLQITLTGSDPVDTGDTISLFTIIDGPANGQITGFDQNTGLLTYTPRTGFFGSDSFTFKVTDNNGAESNESATVSINVKQTTPPPNNPPVALDQSVETFTSVPVDITLQGRDTDQTDTIQSFTIVNSPTNGQITNFDSIAGTLTYTSNTNFVGPDSFTFKVTDNHGADSVNAGTLTITVKQPSTNTAPLPPTDDLCLDNPEKAKGTQGPDVLVGSPQRDTITGLGGNDAINGCASDDTLNGNKDNDGISGSSGNDNINGNEGDDLLFGYSGNDKINGNEGDDRIDAGPGDDSLFGGDGDDIMIGGSGNDKFSCGAGIDTIVDFNEREDKIVGSDCEDVRLQSLEAELQSQFPIKSLTLESLLR